MYSPIDTKKQSFQFKFLSFQKNGFFSFSFYLF